MTTRSKRRLTPSPNVHAFQQQVGVLLSIGLAGLDEIPALERYS